MTEEIIIAGFGGQGVLSMGQLMAYAGMLMGKQVSWIPSYGPEMRGGTANCGVTIANEAISSPVVTEPTTAIIMNKPSLDKFEPIVKKGGLILVNSSLVDKKVTREDVRVVEVPANELAAELGNSRIANIIILGVFIELTGILTVASIIESLKKVLPLRRHNLIPLNEKAMAKGAAFAQKL